MAKATQCIPQKKRSTDFLEDAVITQSVCISLLEMESKEGALSVTSIRDSLDAISCRICSIQNKPVKS